MTTEYARLLIREGREKGPNVAVHGFDFYVPTAQNCSYFVSRSQRNVCLVLASMSLDMFHVTQATKTPIPK